MRKNLPAVAGELLPARRSTAVSRHVGENFTAGKNGRLGGTGKTMHHVGDDPDVRDLASLKKSMPELERAYIKKQEAAALFKTLCDRAGQRFKFDPPVIRLYIAGSCDDTLAKKQRQAEQLQILFEEFAKE